MEKKYSGSSLEECIEKACCDLNVTENELKYKIIENKRILFIKKISILVEAGKTQYSKTKDIESIQNSHTQKDGTIKIEDGKILVKDPDQGGNPAVLSAADNVTLTVDGDIKSRTVKVTSKNEIQYKIKEDNVPKRNLEISKSPDEMQAYITIEYTNQKVYKLKDESENYEVKLETEKIGENKPPIYTEEELIKELNANKVVYGILKDELRKCTSEEGVNHCLIAKGDKVQNDTDDTVDIKFNTEKNVKFNEDSEGRIDFKSIGFVDSIEKGSVVAVKKSGVEGKNGKKISGEVVKKESGKRTTIKAGNGCEFKDENTIIASIGGKPSVIGNKFSVFYVHEVNSDVDMKTGNIKFNGNIVVYGNINENMLVESGNDVNVFKNVENASVIAKGNVNIPQNVIYSKIQAGGNDIEKLNDIEIINSLGDGILKLSEAIKQVQNYNLLGSEVPYGEITKILIESKFKNVLSFSRKVLNIDDSEYEELKQAKDLIKVKIVGLGPINIKGPSEFEEIEGLLKKSSDKIKKLLDIPVSINIGYSQNSTIQSSGSIVITGKGQYISNIFASDYVKFQNPSSISRGGIIKAQNEIRCGIIGSASGVTTKIMVGEKGHIYAKEAYHNTIFYVGQREHMLEEPSKEVHVYMDKNGEIAVEKLAL
ncbi:MAG: FapA family protein [Clostridium sp.]|nr:FapA family protein [Clostridium sp.]